jgi:hypothetical protein
MSKQISFTASIPVRSHHLKFIEYVENLQPGEPLDLKSNSTISNWLRLLLTKKSKTDVYMKSSATKIGKDYNAELKFKIGVRTFDKLEFFYSVKTIHIFNQFIYNYLCDILLLEIRKGCIRGIKEKEVIEQFMEDYGIDEMVDRDTLKKATYRLRKDKKIPSIHRQTSKTA